MTDRAISVFITLKTNTQRTEANESDFHFANKRLFETKNERKPMAKDKLRNTEKLQWADVHHSWSKEDFKAIIRISRTTFNFILDGFYEDLVLTSTNLK